MSWSMHNNEYCIYSPTSKLFGVYKGKKDCWAKGDKPPQFLKNFENMLEAHTFIKDHQLARGALRESIGPPTPIVKCFVHPKAGVPYEARRLTTQNMEEVARWTGGQIKGTKLPPEDRIVEWYDQHFDGGMDIGAKVGQWIIKWGSGFHVCSQEQFDKNFVVTRVGDV